MQSNMELVFQSTPSSQKVTIDQPEPKYRNCISIHTFLTEGDPAGRPGALRGDLFQSTPSSQKVTENDHFGYLYSTISIHTFLTEGDSKTKQFTSTSRSIFKHNN